MKDITYRCNICDDILKQNMKQPTKLFVGFEFGPMNKLVERAYNMVERHICMDCLKGLYDIYEEIDEKSVTGCPF